MMDYNVNREKKLQQVINYHLAIMATEKYFIG